jgi:hypothetical protein
VAVSSLLLLMLGCGGGSSSTLPGIQTTPATNLAYPQPTVTATVGVAISVDTPTVTGTVSSYTVSPALPGGTQSKHVQRSDLGHAHGDVCEGKLHHHGVKFGRLDRGNRSNNRG